LHESTNSALIEIIRKNTRLTPPSHHCFLCLSFHCLYYLSQNSCIFVLSILNTAKMAEADPYHVLIIGAGECSLICGSMTFVNLGLMLKFRHWWFAGCTRIEEGTSIPAWHSPAPFFSHCSLIPSHRTVFPVPSTNLNHRESTIDPANGAYPSNGACTCLLASNSFSGLY
jgi:hypothetical protein